MDKKENNLCTLYLVRHGETEWNVKGITQGQTNSSLTENGKQQALNTANDLKNINFDAIFSSDLTRTQDTAEIIKLDRDIMVRILLIHDIVVMVFHILHVMTVVVEENQKLPMSV